MGFASFSYVIWLINHDAESFELNVRGTFLWVKTLGVNLYSRVVSPIRTRQLTSEAITLRGSVTSCVFSKKYLLVQR